VESTTSLNQLALRDLNENGEPVIRKSVRAMLAMMLCLAVSFAFGQGREKEKPGAGRSAGASNPERKSEGQPANEQRGHEPTGKPQENGAVKSGENPPGGDWSERTHSGKQSNSQRTNGGQPENPGAGYAAEKNNTQASGAQGAAAGAAAANNKTPQTSGAQGAAAGAAYGNNKTPQATGTQGAAAGAAYANRNTPPASGAAGAAAGAAAVNRNSPQYSGAQGAAAGAAAANRNQPQYSGAQGAAAGAAIANQNASQPSGAQGAAFGAAAANNNNQPQLSGAQGAALGAAAANNNQPQFSGAPGAAVGAAVADNSQPQFSAAQAAPALPSATVANMPVISGAASAAAGYETVRSSFNASNVYRPQWWHDHPETWVPAGWIAGAAWHTTPWGAVANFCEYGDAAPTSYNYGINVTAQNGNVFVDGQNVGSTGEFSQQAANIAQAGAVAEAPTSDLWMPLGVFAMVRDEHQHPQFIVQLAINKQGVLRGNYIDELTENTSPIRGAVDRTTKRAAWLVGSNKQTVMEAGLSDLIDPETPALIHKNGKTDHWLLVRLDQPK
jgi:hypothetical protein